MQKITCAEYLSDPGSFREYEQDAGFAYCAESGDFALALAADGVGAYAKSGLASSYAADYLEDFARDAAEDLLKEGFPEFCAELREQVGIIHDELVETSAQMHVIWGTTLTLLAVYRGEYFCVQIGDSRLYLSENGVTRQISVDQTVGQRKRLQGRTDITSKEDNTLTQCIGIGNIAPEYYMGQVEGPASFLVCSDGLSNTLTEEDFEAVLSDGTLPGEEKLRVLDGLARGRDERDNITGVLVEIA